MHTVWQCTFSLSSFCIVRFPITILQDNLKVKAAEIPCLKQEVKDLKKELNGLTSKSNEKLQLKLMENQLKIGSCRCQEYST